MSDILKALNQFLGKATLATFVGDGPETEPQRKGFIELEFKDGDWEYRDSYTGFFKSWGQEVVWHKGNPFWTQLYGGGMSEELQDNRDFAIKTFEFLKKAMSEGEKQEEFQPRGPDNFKDGYWEYTCKWEGNISKFKGDEKILFKGKVVFIHVFFGGVVQ